MGKWRCACYPRDRPRHEFNERLIAEVEERPALWDTRSPKYRNIFVKHSGWKSVAAALMTSEKVVQMRWKNLRDTFLRKVRELEAANGTDAMPMVRWSYFSRLMFLRHSDCNAVKCEQPGNRRGTRLATKQDRIEAAKPAGEPVAEEGANDDEPEVIVEEDGKEEEVEEVSIECEEEPASPLAEIMPVNCELRALSPTANSETSSQGDVPSEWSPDPVPAPSTTLAASESSLVLSDVKSLACDALVSKAVIGECAGRRQLCTARGGFGSSAVVPDSSGGGASSETVADRLDDWDHFLASLKRHLRPTPDGLVGNAQMHLLQVAVSYGAGKVPTALLPLGDL